MFRHVASELQLEMQNATCTKTLPYYKLQIFLCAYSKDFSITGHSKNAPSAVLCKILSPGLNIWENQGQENNGGKKTQADIGGFRKKQAHPHNNKTNKETKSIKCLPNCLNTS